MKANNYYIICIGTGYCFRLGGWGVVVILGYESQKALWKMGYSSYFLEYIYSGRIPGRGETMCIYLRQHDKSRLWQLVHSGKRVFDRES